MIGFWEVGVPESFDTVVIGGGQAGLATSYHLNNLGCDHVVLEQAHRAGNAWRNGRWDSFTLVTPNWAFRMPGAEYEGNEPGGYMPRDEVVARLERYVEGFHLPVRFGIPVDSVEENAQQDGFLVKTDDKTIEARNVVVATGLFQHPKTSPLSTEVPAAVDQIDSGQYRNPGQLREGAVVVVGSAQSGCQIAQELYQSGRRVYLCVGSAGRVPRRYRGKDIFEWMYSMGIFDRTVDDLPNPRARFAAMPHASGRDGGQTLNLHQFARDGVTLMGHLQGVAGDMVHLAPDLKESLTKSDAFESELVARIDRFIAQNGEDAPLEILPALRDGYSAEEITDLHLASAGIKTIVWATGYEFDFSMVRLPVFDGDGYPLQQRGVTRHPGLFFVGLPWLYKQKSGLLIGVGDDAEFLASEIASRNT